MRALAISDLAARLRGLLLRWRSDARGIAAVEFAFIVPLMAVMFIGAVELSQVITINRRVDQVSSATADLVARWSPASGAASANGITQTEITDVMKSGGYIMAPYSQNPLQITIRSVMSSPTSATSTKLWWSCTFNGTGSALSCSCANSSLTVPSGLLGLLDDIVISQATYAYKPLVFDYFMKKGGGGTSNGTYTLSETTYLKPRNGNVNFVPTSGSPCPTPTFP